MDVSTKILSEIVTHMKYAKYNSKLKRRETWSEIVDRNMEMHLKKFPQLETEIRQNYQYVYDKKVLPSMRSIQFAGKPIEIAPNRIYNCCYAPIDDTRIFAEIMQILLGGTGFGGSVQQHHIDKLPEIRKPSKDKTRRFLVGDSIEGWSDAVEVLMKAYFRGGSRPVFDFRDIRPKGARLITSGGKAPGPQPLKECLMKLEGILDSKENGDKLRPIEAYDMICHIADAVLAGGIRRAALITLFSATDTEMMGAKSGEWWETNPQRGRSNNSVVLMRHKITKEFFDSIWQRVQASGSGEPGFYFSNDKDLGTNPCSEISLRAFQFCNLTEVNVSDIESQEDFENRVRAAAFIGTLQASYTEFHYLRPIWQRTTEKEALIGVSMTGIGSGVILNYDMKSAAGVVKAENVRVADILGIKHAARATTTKPSGTASGVLGTASGIHAWHSEYYKRRIRVGKNEAIYHYLLLNHPELLEDDYFRPHDTSIITIPQKAPEGSILRTESPLNLLERIKKVHAEWIVPGHTAGSNTNNSSATISIKPDEWDIVGEWMWKERRAYNGLAILPFNDHSYVQPPFQDCTKEEYEKLMESLTEIDLSKVIEYDDQTELALELACAGGNCELQ